MKNNAKPIVALLSGAILLLGGLCQTTQAQGIVAGTMTDMLILGSTAIGVTDSPTTDINVDSWVTQTGSLYTYNYIIHDPTSDTVGQFSVSQNPGVTVTMTPTTGIFENANGSTILWFWTTAPPVPANGGVSPTLSFTSTEAPVLGDANATDSGSAPSPWATVSTLGQELYVPQAVPEPTTTALLAGCLLFLSFRSTIFKKA
jgi:hypothetical protein